MAKSIFEGSKKVTIAIYNPEGGKVSQISLLLLASDADDIVTLFECMDGDYLGALRLCLYGSRVWMGPCQKRRFLKWYLAVRDLYGRDKVARAFVGSAPRELDSSFYRFRLARTEWRVKAPSPAAAYMVYKSCHRDDVYVYDYLLSEETVFGGCFYRTNKRDPHGIGYMRVVPAGRRERH